MNFVINMKLGELIDCLKKCEEKYGGDMNVCVYNYCHEMPCETIVPQLHNNEFYVNFCENDILTGDFLMLE